MALQVRVVFLHTCVVFCVVFEAFTEIQNPLPEFLGAKLWYFCLIYVRAPEKLYLGDKNSKKIFLCPNKPRKHTQLCCLDVRCLVGVWEFKMSKNSISSSLSHLRKIENIKKSGHGTPNFYCCFVTPDICTTWLWYWLRDVS